MGCYRLNKLHGRDRTDEEDSGDSQSMNCQPPDGENRVGNGLIRVI